MPTCPHCRTSYVVPSGRFGLVERTADYDPPADLCVWMVPEGRRPPMFTPDDPGVILHHCRNGVAV